jgi:hypothetical protein
MGFYELKSLNIPTVSWKSFARDTVLDSSLLWTVRAALEKGRDINLPRAIGVSAEAAMEKGNEFLDQFSDKGLVIYYPYFIAEKSGVLDVNTERTVIEACDKDLWNLVTYGRKNVTLILPNQTGSTNSCYIGDRCFLTEYEINELKSCASIIGRRFRDEISEGRSVLAEWSYAYNTDAGNKQQGSRYLLFYELRDV